MKSLKSNFTLRELLFGAMILPKERELVFRHIWQKDKGNAAKCDRPTLTKVRSSYAGVMTELASKPKTRPYSMPICVRYNEDWFDKKKYVEVCFINPRYEAPAKGLKPWGGKPPKGHYNCNLNKHSKYFAMGWKPTWSKIIDTPVVLEGDAKNLPLTAVLGEILWELTFYGWTEKDQEKNGSLMEKRFEQAKKDIAEGNFVEIPPKKEGGLTVVIPETVQKQLKKIC